MARPTACTALNLPKPAAVPLRSRFARVAWRAHVTLMALIAVSTVPPVPCAGAQSAGKSVIAEAGEQSFRELCASCHGFDARGDGPQASALVTPPPDLTRIAERNGGRFSMPEIAAKIDGRQMPGAHGSSEMPAWGEILSGQVEDPEMAERIVRGQVLEILVYLESIQR